MRMRTRCIYWLALGWRAKCPDAAHINIAVLSATVLLDSDYSRAAQMRALRVARAILRRKGGEWAQTVAVGSWLAWPLSSLRHNTSSGETLRVSFRAECPCTPLSTTFCTNRSAARWGNLGLG
ncbi:hypothetical protein FB451DRAFT_1267575 [Mycena latifolia]|nr:hypothetical protein FB451DRAFT_1267575 [Mycena latifolia]